MRERARERESKTASTCATGLAASLHLNMGCADATGEGRAESKTVYDRLLGAFPIRETSKAAQSRQVGVCTPFLG